MQKCITTIVPVTFTTLKAALDAAMADGSISAIGAQPDVTAENFGFKLALYADVKAKRYMEGTDWRIDMMRIAATLTDAEKAAHDELAISVISGVRGAIVYEMSAGKARFSGMTFERQSAEVRALQRVRELLSATPETLTALEVKRAADLQARQVSFKAGAANKGDKAAAGIAQAIKFATANKLTPAELRTMATGIAAAFAKLAPAV